MNDQSVDWSQVSYAPGMSPAKQEESQSSATMVAAPGLHSETIESPYPTAPTQMPPPGAPQVVPMQPQMGEFDADARTGAGAGLLVVAAGGAVGAALGGIYGAAAGVVGAGAARNIRRASKLWGSLVPEARKEAGLSATTGVAGVIASGFLVYKAYKARK